jgi:aspartyl-tRNA(Asn)/glutamyl-tRNA(Gln) amidotransferase subunit C
MTGRGRIAVEKLAELARLRLDPGETASLERDLERILAAFEALQQIDTAGVEPAHLVGTEPCRPRLDQLVMDASADRGQDLAKRHGPATDGGFYVVPPVLGG